MSLECNVNLENRFSVEWFKNGEPLDSSRAKINKHKIFMMALQRSDQGLYQCIVEDLETHQIAYATVHLSIEGMLP